MGGLGRQASAIGPTNAQVDYPPMLFVFEVDGKGDFPKPAPITANATGNAPAPTAPEHN
jgi:hypothetical protein